MKPHLLFVWFVAISIAGAQAGELSAEDREKLLKRLAEIREAADTRVEARFRVAIAAYRSAMASDEATFALYMNCVEKVDFTDQKKSGQDFRDWRRQNDERLKDSGFRRALRHQLRWLVLSLQAASENADRAQLASSAQDIIDSIVADAKSMEGHEGILNQAVTGSIFARAYDLGDVKVKDWVLAPGQVGPIYEQILLPPHRIARRADALRTGWTKRIQQETALFEARNRREGRGGRIGMAQAARSPEFDKFLTEQVPRMQWQMEVDIFNHGDARGAAMQMLAHLDNHATHASVREWAVELEGMIMAVGGGGVPAVVEVPLVEAPAGDEVEEPVFMD